MKQHVSHNLRVVNSFLKLKENVKYLNMKNVERWFTEKKLLQVILIQFSIQDNIFRQMKVKGNKSWKKKRFI